MLKVGMALILLVCVRPTDCWLLLLLLLLLLVVALFFFIFVNRALLLLQFRGLQCAGARRRQRSRPLLHARRV